MGGALFLLVAGVGMGGGAGVEQIPGIEYLAPDIRLHYRVPDDRLHYMAPDTRLHYRGDET